jgi:altronate dehydratase
VAGVVDYVVKIIERDLLPKYPNVDGVVGLNHLYGCGVAINAPAAVVPIRTIHNIALNPNFGGEVMVIGLGCEKLQPERLLQGPKMSKPFRQTRPASACRTNATSGSGLWSTIFCRLPNAIWISSTAPAKPARPLRWWEHSAAAAMRSPA